ncbi:ABC transporter permease [Haloparvum sedimenti]|uniref:ABC transporter permease n=1 Tax=Haloparvum sedimenti TaxID=1678448 RepID=UPI00071E97F5|nr:ABC transporter permease [Haloparvum sedimenti]
MTTEAEPGERGGASERATSDGPTFETVSLDDGESPSRLDRRVVLLAVGLVAVGAAAAYDLRIERIANVLPGVPSGTIVDWLYRGALWALLLYVVVPLARRPALTRLYWRRLRRDPAAVASLVYLGGFALVAVVGPSIAGPVTEPLIGEAAPREPAPSQPPVFTTVPEAAVYCSGEVVEAGCAGTWQYPLGTNLRGEDVLSLVVHGASVALKVAVIVAALMIPAGVGVGTAAGYRGGRTDEVLMRYVDVQQVLPAFFIVLLLLVVYDGGLLLLVVVFGLLNWGSLARMVRSDVLTKRDAGYVRAARSAGMQPFRIVRRHVVPNTSSTVVSAVSLQLPLVVLLEATMAYLFSNPGRPAARASIWQVELSWGYTIAMGFADGAFPTVSWWVVLFPAVALLATTVSLSLLGDALRDALDPRMEP